MSSENSEKTALVTGGSKQIGAAIVCGLHARGFKVAIHFRNSDREANQLARKLNGLRPESAYVFRANLLDTRAVLQLGAAVVERFSRLDVLVNNASVFSANQSGDASIRQFDELTGIHMKAPYFLTQAVAPFLSESKGCVINITDIYAIRPLPNYALYCATKYGLESLTRSMAMELAPDVRVNAVAPGAIIWPEHDDSGKQEMIQRTPLNRIGDVNEIADMVVFLACDATFMTGQVLTVDGGRIIVSP